VTLWIAILLASGLVYSWKFLGHLVPAKWLAHPRIAKMSAMLTIGLMSGLIGVQAFVTQGTIHPDSRIPAVIVAAILNVLKVPFVLMVALAAATAALCRNFLGWP